MINITKEKMQAYEDVRQSGKTNMFDVFMVSRLSGLTSEECWEIMADYNRNIEFFKIKK